MAARNNMEGQDALFAPTLPNGVALNEGISILIKEMRRGQELQALYWAMQIEVRYYKYLWRRLAIFAAEDVGFANPDLIVRIRALWDSYMQIRDESSKKGAPDGNLLSMAVLMCCRTDKNREVDHLKNIIGHLMNEGQWAPAIPEYALDMHTPAGKARLKTEADRARNWMFESSVVIPDTGYQDGWLWHLRNMQGKGLFNKEEIDVYEEQLRSEGRLRMPKGQSWPAIRYDEHGKPLGV